MDPFVCFHRRLNKLGWEYVCFFQKKKNPYIVCTSNAFVSPNFLTYQQTSQPIKYKNNYKTHILTSFFLWGWSSLDLVAICYFCLHKVLIIQTCRHMNPSMRRMFQFFNPKMVQITPWRFPLQMGSFVFSLSPPSQTKIAFSERQKLDNIILIPTKIVQ